MKKYSTLTDNRFFWEKIFLFAIGAVLNGLMCLFSYGLKVPCFVLIEFFTIILICLLSLSVRNFIKRRETQFVIMSKRVSDLEIILENILSAVIGLDKNGGITFANKAAEKILECREAEVLKKDLSEFIRSNDESDMQLSGLVKNIRSIKEPVYFNDRKIESRSLKNYLISGFLCPVHYSGSTGALLIFNDETERRLKEKELLKKTDKLKDRYEILRKTLSVLPLGILVSDPQTAEVIYANKMFREIHDIPPDIPVSRSTLFKLMSSNLSYRQYLINSHRSAHITSDAGVNWLTKRIFTRNGESRTIRLNSCISTDSRIKVISVIKENERDYNKKFFTRLIEDYECVLERSVDGVVIVDNLGKVVCWNAEMVHLTGIDYCRALNRPIWEIDSEIESRETTINPDNMAFDFLKAAKNFSSSFAKEKEQKIEIKRIVNLYSKKVSLVKIYHNFYRFDNRLRLYRIYRNINELIDIKRQLINQKAFISNLLAASVNWLYIFDLMEKRLIFINSSIKKNDAESNIYFDKEFMKESSVHPDDIDSFKHYLENLKTAENNEMSYLLYRAVSCDGQWKWFLRRDMIYARNKDSSVKQIMGSITEIALPEKMENLLIKRSEAAN